MKLLLLNVIVITLATSMEETHDACEQLDRSRLNHTLSTGPIRQDDDITISYHLMDEDERAQTESESDDFDLQQIQTTTHGTSTPPQRRSTTQTEFAQRAQTQAQTPPMNAQYTMSMNSNRDFTTTTQWSSMTQPMTPPLVRGPRTLSSPEPPLIVAPPLCHPHRRRRASDAEAIETALMLCSSEPVIGFEQFVVERVPLGRRIQEAIRGLNPYDMALYAFQGVMAILEHVASDHAVGRALLRFGDKLKGNLAELCVGTVEGFDVAYGRGVARATTTTAENNIFAMSMTIRLLSRQLRAVYQGVSHQMQDLKRTVLEGHFLQDFSKLKTMKQTLIAIKGPKLHILTPDRLWDEFHDERQTIGNYIRRFEYTVQFAIDYFFPKFIESIQKTPDGADTNALVRNGAAYIYEICGIYYVFSNYLARYNVKMTQFWEYKPLIIPSWRRDVILEFSKVLNDYMEKLLGFVLEREARELREKDAQYRQNKNLLIGAIFETPNWNIFEALAMSLNDKRFQQIMDDRPQEIYVQFAQQNERNYGWKVLAKCATRDFVKKIKAMTTENMVIDAESDGLFMLRICGMLHRYAQKVKKLDIHALMDGNTRYEFHEYTNGLHEMWRKESMEYVLKEFSDNKQEYLYIKNHPNEIWYVIEYGLDLNDTTLNVFPFIDNQYPKLEQIHKKHRKKIKGLDVSDIDTYSTYDLNVDYFRRCARNILDLQWYLPAVRAARERNETIEVTEERERQKIKEFQEMRLFHDLGRISWENKSLVFCKAYESFRRKCIHDEAHIRWLVFRSRRPVVM